MTFKAGLSIALAGASLTAALPAAAQVDPFDGNWHFAVTPYLWLPNVNANLDHYFPRLQTNRLQTEIGPNSYLENLEFGLLVTGEVRKGPWSAFTDLIYLDFGNQETKARDIIGPRGRELFDLGVQTETDLSSTVWTLAGAYTVIQKPEFNLDVLLGFRYLGLDTDVSWAFVRDSALPELDLIRAGSVSENKENWDAIAGVKGQIGFAGTSWFMPYYLDIGTGDSDWTWQALLGVGYRFDWGNVNLSIRSLSYDFDRDNTDLRFTGPALGVSFVW
ncbi:MAG: hypothetical protein ACM3ST_04905 [Bdellovibrio bacteriovorus]